MAGSKGSRKRDRKFSLSVWFGRKARRISAAESLKKEVIEINPNTPEKVYRHDSVLAAATAAKMPYPARMGDLCRRNKSGSKQELNGRIFMYASDYNRLGHQRTRKKQKCAASTVRGGGGGGGAASGGRRVDGDGGGERAAGLRREGNAPAPDTLKAPDLDSSRGVLRLEQLHQVEIVVPESNSQVRGPWRVICSMTSTCPVMSVCAVLHRHRHTHTHTNTHTHTRHVPP